jgi:hypothetical protein
VTGFLSLFFVMLVLKCFSLLFRIALSTNLSFKSQVFGLTCSILEALLILDSECNSIFFPFAFFSRTIFFFESISENFKFKVHFYATTISCLAWIYAWCYCAQSRLALFPPYSNIKNLLLVLVGEFFQFLFLFSDGFEE